MDQLLTQLPIVGQYSFLGLSLAFNIFCLVKVISGDLVPLSRVTQWHKAWEISMQTQQDTAEIAKGLAEGIQEFSIVAETVAHLIDSLPKVDPK